MGANRRITWCIEIRNDYIEIRNNKRDIFAWAFGGTSTGRFKGPPQSQSPAGFTTKMNGKVSTRHFDYSNAERQLSVKHRGLSRGLEELKQQIPKVDNRHVARALQIITSILYGMVRQIKNLQRENLC